MCLGITFSNSGETFIVMIYWQRCDITDIREAFYLLKCQPKDQSNGNLRILTTTVDRCDMNIKMKTDMSQHFQKLVHTYQY